MIELKEVTKYFVANGERKYILKNETLVLPTGNIGILGRNGAGKSTLMRMLGKIEFPNSGKIASRYNFSWPMGLSSGFVGNMTGRQNVKFVCDLYGKEREEKREIVQSVYEFSELGDYFDMPMKTYSSGMKGRLGFGLSLAFDFDYLLIDETLSVGDAKFREKAKAALHKKVSECNIILVSHEMKTLREMCQTGLLLHEGKLHFFEDIDEGVKEYNAINQFT